MDTNTSNKNYQPFLEALEKLGFCTFKIFDDAVIADLKTLYETHFGEKEIKQLYASHNSNPVEKSLTINNEIKNIVNQKLQEVFPDFEYFVGHYMVKGAHTENVFSLHQDWNILDESKYKSYQIWIPLQLTYPENGGLFVVPGSHTFFNNFRSGSYDIPVVPSDKTTEMLKTDVIVPSGNILIYQNALFHASYPNQTDEKRIAVIVNFVQKNAPTYFFQKNSLKNETDLYPITGETLIRNLPELEKGIVSNTLSFTATTKLSSIENNEIKSEDLRKAFNLKFGKVEATQIKQLHISKDEKLEKQLNEQGYAVVDFLDDETIGKFKQEYFKNFGDIDRTPGRFTTLQDTTPILKKKMHEFIVTNVEIAMQKYFKDYIIPVSQFYIKKAFTSGDIDLHADSTLLLNHQLEPHYGIWVPLVAVDEGNGCLTVVPKSHVNNKTIYGGSFPGRQEVHKDWLKQFEVPIPLKAGQAIVFDNNLLHNSTANKSSRDRICFTFRTTHWASDYYSFICNVEGENSLEVYLESHDYYMDEKWDGEGEYISGKLIGTMQNSIIDFKKEDILKVQS